MYCGCEAGIRENARPVPLPVGNFHSCFFLFITKILSLGNIEPNITVGILSYIFLSVPRDSLQDTILPLRIKKGAEQSSTVANSVTPLI